MSRSTSSGWAACAFALMLAGCSKQEEKPPSMPPPLSPPVMTNATPNVTLPPQPVLPLMVATIEGARENPVNAPKAGYLVRQVYKDGAMVSDGDVLFLLDPRASHPDASPGSASDMALVKVNATGSGIAAHALRGAGDHVEQGDELTHIAQIENVIAELTVSDDLARDFQHYLKSPAGSSQPAIELILPDGSSYPTHGVIASVTTSGSVNTMQIDFPNPTHVLLPGEFVKVRGLAP